MISTPDRQKTIALINETIDTGACQATACESAGISPRTYQRWTDGDSIKADGRTTAKRKAPANKLSRKERASIVATCNSAEYASLPPSQIVPALADKGMYIGSESSFYRVLREVGQVEWYRKSRH